jgi:hypothetical protein
MGFVHVGRDHVFTGSIHTTAVVTWTPDDKQVRLSSFMLQHIYRNWHLAGHPKLPVLYAVPLGLQDAFRFEHADGQLTLLPQRATFAGSVLGTPPIVMGKANKLAVGGQWNVFVVPLDDEGRFKPERVQHRVNAGLVEALAYSDKFDRLYVAVEKAP